MTVPGRLAKRSHVYYNLNCYEDQYSFTKSIRSRTAAIPAFCSDGDASTAVCAARIGEADFSRGVVGQSARGAGFAQLGRW